MLEKLFKQYHDIFDQLVAIRRDLHMHPELSHEEVETPKKIANFLKNLDIEVTTEVGGRGVLGLLRGGKPGKTIALRADFDALPIQDAKEVSYKSTVPGVMHACGHDVHTATLLGVAKILANVREHIKGNVLFVHQFGEEVTPGGAKFMIDDGCLDGVDVIYGAHVMATDELGKVNILEGAFSSAQDDFEINIHGKGGHGSSPHETIDALVTGSQLVVNLQQIVSRRIDPLHAAALTVGSFQSGQTNNIIADTATLKGTVRTYDEHSRELIEEALKQVTKSTCEAAGAQYDIKYVNDCPSMWNDYDATKRVEKVAKEVLGADNIYRGGPMMGSEDFAYYQQEIPGCYFNVGAKKPESEVVYPHHHPMFDVDERVMQHIGRVFIGLVFEEDK